MNPKSFLSLKTDLLEDIGSLINNRYVSDRGEVNSKITVELQKIKEISENEDLYNEIINTEKIQEKISRYSDYVLNYLNM